jgi:hypothetical protein
MVSVRSGFEEVFVLEDFLDLVINSLLATILNRIHGHFPKKFTIKHSLIRFIMAIFSVVIVNVGEASHDASGD